MSENKVQLPYMVAKEFRRMEETKLGTIGKLRFWCGDTVYELDSNVVEWVRNHEEIILKAMLYGYEELPDEDKFFLRNKLTTSYLVLDKSTGYYEHWNINSACNVLENSRYQCRFTSEEIEELEADSYEPILLEDLHEDQN